MRSYSAKRFNPKLEFSFIENILYYLSKGDPGRIRDLRRTKLKDIYNYYYLSRIKDLDELLGHIAYLRHMKELEKK